MGAPYVLPHPPSGVPTHMLSAWGHNEFVQIINEVMATGEE